MVSIDFFMFETKLVSWRSIDGDAGVTWVSTSGTEESIFEGWRWVGLEVYGDGIEKMMTMMMMMMRRRRRRRMIIFFDV